MFLCIHQVVNSIPTPSDLRMGISTLVAIMTSLSHSILSPPTAHQPIPRANQAAQSSPVHNLVRRHRG